MQQYTLSSNMIYCVVSACMFVYMYNNIIIIMKISNASQNFKLV